MQWRYDEDFVEAAVFVCTAGHRRAVSALQIARFHRERERPYAILDPDERNSAFFRLHMEWFREWGLAEQLTRPLEAFPLVSSALQTLVFRKARGKKDDGAELYVNDAGNRTGVVSMGPERLEDDSRLTTFLHHEFFHLQDMVDPAFGYRPELIIPRGSVAQQRLARERYAVLWDTSIDGRLHHSGRPTTSHRQGRWQEFANAFGFWPEEKQQHVFDSVWSDPAPAHKRFEELVCDPRQLNSAGGPQPGGLCPLCGFPTFVWAGLESLGEVVTAAIRAEFPHWSTGQGACGRCFEIYRRRNLPESIVV